LVKKLDSSSAHDRSAALTALYVIRAAELPSYLTKAAKDSSASVRRLAIFYLAELRAKYAVAIISERLSDKSQEVRAAARVAYRKITGTND